MTWMATKLQIKADRRLREMLGALARDLLVFREDAGISQRRLSRLSGISQGHVSRIEAGASAASLETYNRLAVALGADLSVRLYPGTGPSLRDRHQIRIADHLLASLGSGWTAHPEVPVWRPVRGWIDLVLVDLAAGAIVAVEIESGIRRLEQQVRWAQAKAEALESARLWPFGADGATRSVSRLLVVRATRESVALSALARHLLDTAYPANPTDALASLRGAQPWPGAAVIWARISRDGAVRLLAQSDGRRAAA
jgi:transcriptional regulator with XRE-family HTH domain